MIYLHFIVNPISGKGKHAISKELLLKNFSIENYRVEVEYTEYKNHPKELAATAILKKTTLYYRLRWGRND